LRNGIRDSLNQSFRHDYPSKIAPADAISTYFPKTINTREMKIKLICLSLTIVCFTSAFTQTTYQSAIGLRIGTGYSDLFSASFKTFLSGGPGALELNLGVKPSYTYTYGNPGNPSYYNSDITMMSFSASYQYHVPITALDGLQWFVGGGLTLTNTFSDQDGYNGIGLGIFPTGGVDYKFGNIPLDVSVDIRPTFRIASPTYYNYESVYFPDFGFSARYTLK
jgi:hypothetical protein